MIHHFIVPKVAYSLNCLSQYLFLDENQNFSDDSIIFLEYNIDKSNSYIIISNGFSRYKEYVNIINHYKYTHWISFIISAANPLIWTGITELINYCSLMTEFDIIERKKQNNLNSIVITFDSNFNSGSEVLDVKYYRWYSWWEFESSLLYWFTYIIENSLYFLIHLTNDVCNNTSSQLEEICFSSSVIIHDDWSLIEIIRAI
jgi:hypothetical protein